MNLILPIAGVGKRLRPFTFSKPKGFVKIGGSRGVDHIIQKIQNSINEKSHLCLVTGYKSDQIQDYMEEHYSSNFYLDYSEQIPIGYQDDVPFFSGLGHAILITKSWYDKIGGISEKNVSESTLIFLSDMIPVTDYRHVFEVLNDPEVDGVIGSMRVPAERTRFYGMIEVDSKDRITNLCEKPEFTESRLAISGVYALKAKPMQRLYEILQELYTIHCESIEKDNLPNIEFHFTPALQKLVDEGYSIKSAQFVDGILDFGQPDALLNGNSILLQSNGSKIDMQTVKIDNSFIVNPCAVGDGTSILRAIIGPNVSIGKNCVIEDCNLENVVIGDNCILKKIISKQSIIGDNVHVIAITKDHLSLGDNSFLLEFS